MSSPECYESGMRAALAVSHCRNVCSAGLSARVAATSRAAQNASANSTLNWNMDKGARGVVGTQCETPALFAAKWAERFFDRFFAGEAIGDAFLDLRREFLEQHGNPLGLLYAVHCDGDTRIEPAFA